VHEIISFEVTAANALGLASLPEEPLDESSDEDFSCFNQARSFRQHQSGRDSFRGAGQHLLSSGGGPVHSDLLSSERVIPSGSMKNTLLVGDHLVVDRITLMPPASWMPLIRYREPRRGDIVVFIKPVQSAWY
jgi:hypothetical protein